MKKTAKATALILLISLVSACSSPEEKACKAAQQAKKDYDAQVIEINSRVNLPEEREEAIRAVINSSRTVVNFPSCFTPSEVFIATDFLSNIQ